MSPKRCDRTEDVARLEVMSEDDARSFGAHVLECEDCTRARVILERSRGALARLSPAPLSPDARVELRMGIDERIDAEMRPRATAWLPISITAATVVLAVALWFRFSETPPANVSALPAPLAAVAAGEIAPAKTTASWREPAVLRAGSRVPIEGGLLSIESDATLALEVNRVHLLAGKIRVDVAGDEVFVVETPKAEIDTADGELLVIAGRDELRIDVVRGSTKVRAQGSDEVQSLSAGASIVLPPPVAEARRAKVAVSPPKTAPRRVSAAVEPAVVAPGRPQIVASVELPREKEQPRIEEAAATPEIPRTAAIETPNVEAPAPAEPDARALIAEADRARRSDQLERAAELYHRVSEIPGPLAEEAAYLYADTLAKSGKHEEALSALRAQPGGHLAPERTALRVQIMLALDRIEEAAGVLEGAGETSVELASARLAVARAAVDERPELARRLVAPLLPDWNPRAVRLRAMRIAVLAAHAQGDKENETAMRAKLDQLEN